MQRKSVLCCYSFVLPFISLSNFFFKYIYSKNNYNYDFEFDKSVDGQNHGLTTGGMKLRFITEASADANVMKLTSDSKGYEAICQLSSEYSIFSDIENALKIDKYWL